MSHCLQKLLAVAVALAAVGAGAGDDKETKSTSQAKKLLGPIQTLCVTGPCAGKFHCPICETGLEPGVLVVIREAGDLDKLGDLLPGLDKVIEKHPDAQFGACAILLEDGGYRNALETGIDLAKAAEKKESLERKLKELAKAKKLTHVTLALGMQAYETGPGGKRVTPVKADAYGINPDKPVSVLLYYKHEISSGYPVVKDKLEEPDVQKILKDVEALAARAEKPTRPARP